MSLTHSFHIRPVMSLVSFFKSPFLVMCADASSHQTEVYVSFP